MFEALKEEIKNSLKEMKEKTDKKLRDVNKALKENQEKAIKRVKETIHDLKPEIKVIKKTKAKGIIETEIMRKYLGTTNVSINSRIQEMEKRISNTEDTREEIDLSVKENVNLTKA